MRIACRIALALLATLPASLVAQGSRLQPGIEAAVNFAKFTGDDASGSEVRTGFAAGGFLRFPVSKVFSLEPAFYYSMQGTEVDAGGGASVTFKLDYFQLPLRFRFSAPLGPNPSLRPYVYVAPAIGVRESCRIKAQAQGQSLEVDCDDEAALGVSFDTKTFETGLHFGAGVEYQRFSVGVRYQFALNSIDDTGADADIRNRFIAITAGYRFGGAR